MLTNTDIHDRRAVIDCDFDNDEMRCPRCRFKAGGRDWHRNCPLASGLPVPGQRLMVLLQDFEHLKLKSGCGCQRYAQMMDSWGVEKCRERRAEIVRHLLDEAGVTNTELPFGLDLADLLGDLVDEAIRLAEWA